MGLKPPIYTKNKTLKIKQNKKISSYNVWSNNVTMAQQRNLFRMGSFEEVDGSFSLFSAFVDRKAYFRKIESIFC